MIRGFGQEDAMDINPDDAQQYLQGVEYPASKEDVVSAAENNAPPKT